MLSYLFSACEPTRDYIYWGPGTGPNTALVMNAITPPGRGVSLVTLAGTYGWNDFGAGKVYQARPDNWNKFTATGLTVKECGIICTMNPTCQGWSARTMHRDHDGCKLFTTKDNKYMGNEYMVPWGATRPTWISGERGCYGKKIQSI